MIANLKTSPAPMQRIEKHLWPPVKVWSYVHIFTWNQPQKVGTQQKPGPELGQWIWGPFFSQTTQKIHFYPAIVHYLIFKKSKLHQEFIDISFFSVKARQYVHIQVIFCFIY